MHGRVSILADWAVVLDVLDEETDDGRPSMKCTRRVCPDYVGSTWGVMHAAESLGVHMAQMSRHCCRFRIPYPMCLEVGKLIISLVTDIGGDDIARRRSAPVRLKAVGISLCGRVRMQYWCGLVSCCLTCTSITCKQH